jgi:hypothetical protein
MHMSRRKSGYFLHNKTITLNRYNICTAYCVWAGTVITKLKELALADLADHKQIQLL